MAGSNEHKLLLYKWQEDIQNLKGAMRHDRVKTAEMALVFAKKLFALTDDKYLIPVAANMRLWFTFQWQIRDDHKIECAITRDDGDVPYAVQVFVDECDSKLLPFNTDQEQDDALAVIVSEFLQECKLDKAGFSSDRFETKTEYCNALFDWIMRPPSADIEYDNLVANIDELALPLMKKLYPHHIQELPTFGYTTNGSISINWDRPDAHELHVIINLGSYDVRSQQGKVAASRWVFTPAKMDQLVGYLAQTYADLFQ